MKIFRIYNLPSDPTTDNIGNRAIACIPDTAILIHKRPFFIPDFAENCRAQLCAGIRINRLGRSIHTQFAHRYYCADEICLSIHFEAANLLQELKRKGLPWDKAVGFDNAVAMAEKGIGQIDEQTKVEIRINNKARQVLPDWKKLHQDTIELIAKISQFYTLRQGDILLLPLPVESQEVHIDDRICLYSNETEMLAFNIK